MRIISTAILYTLFVTGSSYAGIQSRYLLPSPSALNAYQFQLDYFLAVRKILYPNLSRIPIFRMTSLPSFEPEWAIEIEEKDDNTAIINYVSVEGRIWANDNPENLKVFKKSEKLPIELAQSIGHLLDENLKKVHYVDSDTFGLDGTSYYFTNTRKGKGYRSGEAWSPDNESPTGRLVETGELLRKLVNDQPNNSEEIEIKIKEIVATALDQLNEKPSQNEANQKMKADEK